MEDHLDVGDIVYGHNKQHRYKVIRELGKGGFGAVYEVEQLLKEAEPPGEYNGVRNTNCKKPKGPRYAMKCELLEGKARILKMELTILREFKNGGRHFCQVYDRSRTETFNFIVMTLLGHNLFDLKKVCPNSHFTIGTALRVAVQTLESLEDFHEIGYLHRDIKPGNFAIGSPTVSMAEQRKIYILDFGLSRKFKNNDGELRRQRTKAGFRGTTRYASVSSHKEEDLGRKDDLESWLYVTIELTKGALPWRDLPSKEKEQVLELKQFARDKRGAQDLLRDCPRNFERILDYIDELKFWSKPDYGFIYELLRRAAARANVNDDDPYDWEEGGTHREHTERLPPPRVLSDKEVVVAVSPLKKPNNTEEAVENQK